MREYAKKTKKPNINRVWGWGWQGHLSPQTPARTHAAVRTRTETKQRRGADSGHGRRAPSGKRPQPGGERQVPRQRHGRGTPARPQHQRRAPQGAVREPRRPRVDDARAGGVRSVSPACPGAGAAQRPEAPPAGTPSPPRRDSHLAAMEPSRPPTRTHACAHGKAQRVRQVRTRPTAIPRGGGDSAPHHDEHARGAGADEAASG